MLYTPFEDSLCPYEGSSCCRPPVAHHEVQQLPAVGVGGELEDSWLVSSVLSPWSRDLYLSSTPQLSELTEHVGSVVQTDDPQVPVFLRERTDRGPGGGPRHQDLCGGEVFTANTILSSNHEVDLREEVRWLSRWSPTDQPVLAVSETATAVTFPARDQARQILHPACQVVLRHFISGRWPEAPNHYHVVTELNWATRAENQIVSLTWTSSLTSTDTSDWTILLLIRRAWLIWKVSYKV